MSEISKYIDYNLVTIRNLVESLMDQQLKNLCLIHFKDIYDDSKGRSELQRSLLEYADRQYLISRLLKEIKKTNPNAYSLSESELIEIKIGFNQTCGLQFLTNLVPSLGKFILMDIDILRRAFLDSCPSHLDKSPSEKIPDSLVYLFQCVDILADLPLQNRNKIHPLQNFVHYLENPSNKGNQSTAITKHDGGKIICRLVLQLRKTTDYKIQAWTRFIKDSNSSADKLPIDKCLTEGEESYNCLEEISKLLEHWLNKIASYVRSFGNIDIHIEFFLPCELLSEEVDQILEGKSSNSLPIGQRYPVIVRPLERHDYQGAFAYNNLHRRWNLLKRYKTILVIDCCDPKSRCAALRIKQELDDLRSFANNLVRTKGLVCSLLEYPPKLVQKKTQECVVSTLIKEGIPIMLWIRDLPPTNMSDVSFSELYDLIHKKPHFRLANQTMQLRGEAKTGNDAPWHLGAHLTLLWDNPYLSHPNLPLQDPNQTE